MRKITVCCSPGKRKQSSGKKTARAALAVQVGRGWACRPATAPHCCALGWAVLGQNGLLHCCLERKEKNDRSMLNLLYAFFPRARECTSGRHKQGLGDRPHRPHDGCLRELVDFQGTINGSTGTGTERYGGTTSNTTRPFPRFFP